MNGVFGSIAFVVLLIAIGAINAAMWCSTRVLALEARVARLKHKRTAALVLAIVANGFFLTAWMLAAIARALDLVANVIARRAPQPEGGEA